MLAFWNTRPNGVGARETRGRTHRFCRSFPAAAVGGRLGTRACSTTDAHFTNHSAQICAARSPMALGSSESICRARKNSRETTWARDAGTFGSPRGDPPTRNGSATGRTHLRTPPNAFASRSEWARGKISFVARLGVRRASSVKLQSSLVGRALLRFARAKTNERAEVLFTSVHT